MAKIKKIKMPDNRILDIVDAGAVRFNESQSLTSSQKSVGRANIGAGTVNTKDETPSSAPVVINADTLGGNAPSYYATVSELTSLSGTVTTLQATKADVTNGTVISDNADFAEIGEWHDGNPSSENRLGYFVTLTTTVEGFVIDKATTSSDVCGVIVEAPAFSGNADDKYNADGTLKPQYDYVALLGLVSVIDNGTCTVPGKCMSASDGTAIPSTNNMGFNVITRLDSTHIEVFVRPAADMLKRIKDDVVALQSALNGKISKVANATAGNIAELTAVGDVIDSNFSMEIVSSMSGTDPGVVTAEDTSNKVTSITSSSTNVEYPSARAVYDLVNPLQTGKEDTSNKVTLINSSSTNVQYPSAKAVYDSVSSVQTNKADKSSTVTATLLAASWVGSSAPYVYTLSVQGVTATSNQEILPATDITLTQLQALQSANIQDGGQSADVITLCAWGIKPTIDIPIRVLKRGD